MTRRASRFGNGRMHSVLRGLSALGQDFEDYMPATAVGVDTIPLDQTDWSGDYAQSGDDWTGASVYGNTADAVQVVTGSGETEQVATVMDSLPAPSLNTDMLNKLVAVGGKVFKMVQENGKVVPRATGQTIATSSASRGSGPQISGKQLLIGAAIAYLLFA